MSLETDRFAINIRKQVFNCRGCGARGDVIALTQFLDGLRFPDCGREAMREPHRRAPTAFEERRLTSVILIEDKASGTQLIQDLLKAGLSRITRYKPDGDKIMRLHAQTATIENGFVHLPETAHWLADYLHELTLFPAGRYDDQVDSTAQALAWTKIRPPGWGIVEFYRELSPRSRWTTAETPISLKASLGMSHVDGLSGQQYMVKDGIVTVVEDDAPPLLRSGFVTQT